MKLINTLSRVIGLLTILIIFGCESGDQNSSESQTNNDQQNEKGIPVEGLIVKSRKVDKTISLSGMLDPKHSVDILAEVSGKIVEINKKVGDRVSNQDILAKIDDKIPLGNYEQAKSQVLSAKNNLDITQLNLLSDEELYQSGDISKLEYENSLLTVKTAEANHLSALATLGIIEKAYDDTKIKSPINGLIARKYVEFGTMVNLNSPLYRVVDISSLKIEVGVPQEIVASIKPGTKTTVEISALDSKVFTGQIKYISPQADENTGSFTVEIFVDNTLDAKIKAGMTARVEITLSSQADQIVIPDHAVMTKNDKSYVFILSKSKAKLIPIKIRDTYESLILIDDGLSLGDTIVDVGIKNIKDGSPIWIEVLN